MVPQRKASHVLQLTLVIAAVPKAPGTRDLVALKVPQGLGDPWGRVDVVQTEMAHHRLDPVLVLKTSSRMVRSPMARFSVVRIPVISGPRVLALDPVKCKSCVFRRPVTVTNKPRVISPVDHLP